MHSLWTVAVKMVPVVDRSDHAILGQGNAMYVLEVDSCRDLGAKGSGSFLHVMASAAP